MKHIELGRTMLEMLGVLAIIGIISSGGLMGYSYAMKRLRANELLNEANKQAVLVASALMSNSNPENIPSIDAPTTPYGTFGNSVELDGDDKFKLTVSGLEGCVCNLMKNLAMGPIRRLKCNLEEDKDTFIAEMYFNKDLSTEERASDYNGNQSACKSKEGYKYCESNDICVKQEEECPAFENTCETVLDCGLHGTWNDEECKCDCDVNWYGKLCDCDGMKSQELNTCLSCNSYITRELLKGLHLNDVSECHHCDNYYMGISRCLHCDNYYLEPEVESEEECKRCEELKAFVYEGKIYCGKKECGTGYTQLPDGKCQTL